MERADRRLLDLLRLHSLREISESLGLGLDDWPRPVDIELVYALQGHVARWVGLGTIKSEVRSVEPREL